MAGALVQEFTDQNFETEVLKSEQPVLVDFWAPWCMPCKYLGPTIDKLAEAYAGRVKVGKVDTDEHRDAALKLGISSLPTVVIFKGGQVVHKMLGVRAEKEFRDA
jgi:thioredoxin 1